MSRLKELEQLKNEYKEIPIPEDGVDGVKRAIERAKQKKRLKTRVVRYSTMAAAAVLLFLVIPKDVFMSNNKAMDSMEGIHFADKMNGGAAPESSKDIHAESSVNPTYQTGNSVTEAPQSAADGVGETTAPMTPGDSDYVAGESEAKDELKPYGILMEDAQVRERISEEIRRQIKEAVLLGKECFTADRIITENFVCITDEQEYYLNKEGFLVIVFAPGEIAPAEYGKMEFVIPDEVIGQ